MAAPLPSGEKEEVLKIKLLVGMAGDKFAYSPGEIVDLDKAWAERLIGTGQAEEVKTEKKGREKAALKPGEDASLNG